jgi:hypothetical protein
MIVEKDPIPMIMDMEVEALEVIMEALTVVTKNPQVEDWLT